MDFVILKYIHDSKKKLIENLDNNTPSSAPSGLLLSPSISVAGIIAAAPPGSAHVATGVGVGALVSWIVLLIVALYAAYLSWDYTGKHNIDMGMRLIYAIGAFNCGSLFLVFYLLFANK